MYQLSWDLLHDESARLACYIDSCKVKRSNSSILHAYNGKMAELKYYNTVQFC